MQLFNYKTIFFSVVLLCCFADKDLKALRPLNPQDIIQIREATMAWKNEQNVTLREKICIALSQTLNKLVFGANPPSCDEIASVLYVALDRNDALIMQLYCESPEIYWMFGLILKLGVDIKTPLYFSYKFQNGALFCAAGNNNARAIEHLFEKGGIDVSIRSCDLQDTALHYACCNRGNLSYSSNRDIKKLIEFLINKGAEIEAVSSKGFTPLFVAAYQVNLPAVIILLQRGADKNKKMSDGKTVFELVNEGVENSRISFPAGYVDKLIKLLKGEYDEHQVKDLIEELFFKDFNEMDPFGF
ncbi:TPA: hypothetical protein DEO28_03420 [Candidatus Dependentiae bacterium]|nr:MAG: hypothetical protein UR43_C0004G0195 [candidate division TM6 bacterium GW2011_GWF2_33_332]HBS48107.1 hypothetical protein [Candidatus Dependentiae bacterium]HBZ73531.1 hypothetical protein [Candidatus Dependentiae bacterium]